MKNVTNKLQVWHYPQIPCEPFMVDVANETEARLIKNALADQHLWLFKHSFIPDYCNMVEVMMYEEGYKEWIPYYNEQEKMDWEELEECYYP